MKHNRTYRVLDGCHNCIFVYAYTGTDCYYCTYGAKKRPRSGAITIKYGRMTYEESHVLNMKGKPLSSAIFNKRHDAWMKWSQGREVLSYGICNHHKRSKKCSNS